VNEGSGQIRLAGSILGKACHVCAFFNNRDEEYRVLLPFVRDGLDRGEKIVHTIDPERRREHLERLAAGGIDVATLVQDGRFELRTWSDTHLLDGYFDQHRTLDRLWQAFWDAVFVFSNLLLAVLFGAALGNIARGVP
jgi:hypothetical protein